MLASCHASAQDDAGRPQSWFRSTDVLRAKSAYIFHHKPPGSADEMGAAVGAVGPTSGMPCFPLHHWNQPGHVMRWYEGHVMRWYNARDAIPMQPDSPHLQQGRDDGHDVACFNHAMSVQVQPGSWAAQCYQQWAPEGLRLWLHHQHSSEVRV